MGDQRVNIEIDQSVVLNDHDHEDSESCSSLTMALDQDESVMAVRINEGLVDHNTKDKGVLEENAVEEMGLKNKSVSIDVKLDDNGGEMVCRICHLGGDQSPERFLGGKTKESCLVELGCGCKDELGVAHSHCAETWFKLKGNRICEICGEAARNVKGIIQEAMLVEWHNRRLYGGNGGYSAETSSEWWRGQPCCNFLMACLIVAFVLPWFFRAKIV